MKLASLRRQRAFALSLLVLLRTLGAAADQPQSTAAAAPVEPQPSPPAGLATQPRATPVPADTARRVEAEERRQRALRFYDAGNYSAAKGEFERANQVLPNFRLLYNLGVVSMALADSASAYEFFERYLQEGGDSVPPEMRRDVTAQLRDLAEQVATIVLQVTPPGTRIFIDDTPIGAAPLARPLRVNPGSRRLSAQMAGRQRQTRTLELAGGQTVRIDLRLEPATPVSVKPPTRIFWVGWTATTVLAVGAVFTGLEAISTHQDYEQKLDTIGTTRSELDALDARATGFAIAADTLAAAAVITGVYSLYVTLKHPKHGSPSGQLGITNSLRASGNQLRFGFVF